MLLKCCLLHRGNVLPRHAIFSTFVFISTFWSIYVLFIVIYFAIDSSIFITINQIISLIQTNLFLGYACQCCLAFAYFFFCQFQSGIAYKSVAYKKSVILQLNLVTIPKMIAMTIEMMEISMPCMDGGINTFSTTFEKVKSKLIKKTCGNRQFQEAMRQSPIPTPKKLLPA